MFDKYQNNLELRLQCNSESLTICPHRYTTHPYRLSPIFRLDNSARAYLYIMNTSPGVLAGDKLKILLELDNNSQLYLTDQSATKVHQMPAAESKATIDYQIILRSHSSLEFVPEPIILYKDAALKQNTIVNLDRTAQLFLTEIVLPGRIAKAEYYQFNYYFNSLQVCDLEGELLFKDANKLIGKNNPFKDSKLFAPLPIIGNAIAIYPDFDLKLLSNKLKTIQQEFYPEIVLATSILPRDRGLLIRAFANKTAALKQYFNLALDCIRQLRDRASLPYVPK